MLAPGSVDRVGPWRRARGARTLCEPFSSRRSRGQSWEPFAADRRLVAARVDDPGRSDKALRGV